MAPQRPVSDEAAPIPPVAVDARGAPVTTTTESKRSGNAVYASLRGSTSGDPQHVDAEDSLPEAVPRIRDSQPVDTSPVKDGDASSDDGDHCPPTPTSPSTPESFSSWERSLSVPLAVTYAFDDYLDGSRGAQAEAFGSPVQQHRGATSLPLLRNGLADRYGDRGETPPAGDVARDPEEPQNIEPVTQEAIMALIDGIQDTPPPTDEEDSAAQLLEYQLARQTTATNLRDRIAEQAEWIVTAPANVRPEDRGAYEAADFRRILRGNQVRGESSPREL